MTTAAIQDRVDELFTDARNVHAQAIERLQNGDIRDAAEKAWCATKRATDALILARTGYEPLSTTATSDHLDDLCHLMPEIQRLQDHYYSRIHNLHDMCFRSGHCNNQTVPDIATTRPSTGSRKLSPTSTTPRTWQEQKTSADKSHLLEYPTHTRDSKPEHAHSSSSRSIKPCLFKEQDTHAYNSCISRFRQKSVDLEAAL